MTPTHIQKILDSLQAVKSTGNQKWKARCPAHDDKHPSLDISIGKEDRALMKCRAGCDWHAILRAIGLRGNALFSPDSYAQNSDRTGRIVKVYEYTDANGVLLHEKVRFKPKAFNQRNAAGEWTMKGVTRVLYGLPKVTTAATVYIANGEKAADALTGIGVTATCDSQGEGKWLDDYNESLRAKHVVIPIDNDATGELHGYKAGKSLTGIAASVKVIRLPGLPPKGDAFDWIAAGGTAAQLAEIVAAAPLFDSAGPAPANVDEAEVLDRRNPLANARRFRADAYTHSDGSSRLINDGELFMRFNGVCYEQVPPAELRQQQYRFLESKKVSVKAGDGFELRDFKPTKGDIDGQTDALAADSFVGVRPPMWLDGESEHEPKNLIVATNGIFCLTSDGPRLISPSTPRFYTVTSLDYDLLLDAKPPEEWLEFLDSILPDDREQIELIQEWFGYCLTPDTSQQKALLLLGPPRSGKGTIARVLTRLLGVANVAGPTLSSLGGPFGLWTLVGKMLAIVSDARLSGRTDQAIVTERLLSITGEDFLTIDRKMIHPVTLRLISRVMVLSNELPKLADSSGALSNRFLITSLERSFLGEEDTGLEDRLMAELPGILLWSIAGWRRLKARGRFIQPSAGEEIRRELNDLASPIGAFIRDLCRVNVGASETVVDLYEAWLAWCASQGRHATTEKNVFGRDLRAAIPGVTTRQKRDGELVARRFEGVGLTEVGKATLSLWRSHTQGTQAKPPVTQQARSKQGETAESEAAYVG